MTAKHNCSGKTWSDNPRDVSGRVYKCQRNATVEHEGKHYCWQHDPERVEADKKRRRASWQAKMDREDTKWERRARNAKLAALVTEETATMLDQIAMLLHNSSWHKYAKGEIKDARALAARIRESIGENT